MLSAVPRKRSRADYKRWERDAAMQFWQMDAMGSVMITDPEVKLITGVDDHSRFCVIATVVAHANYRAGVLGVCRGADRVRRPGPGIDRQRHTVHR
jgi:hypothetical protein